MDAASFSLLSRLIEMGTCSLLQYTCELVPYTPPGMQAVRAQVFAMADEERAEVARFTRYLQKQHMRLKTPASYPSHFTTMNFCSLDFLLPKLRVEHEKEIAEIASRLPAIANEEVGKMAQAYLDMKRRHLASLSEALPKAAA
jgi:hypothetical protein